MIEVRTEYNKFFGIYCMKDPDYVKNIMASWMTLGELEGANTRGELIDSIGMKEKNKFTSRNQSGVILGSYINCKTTTTGYMRQFPQRGHWQPSSDLITNFLGISPCQKLIQLLCRVTFKIMRQCNQVYIFGDIWKYSYLRIKLGLDWQIMDDLCELLKFLYTSLVKIYSKTPWWDVGSNPNQSGS